MESIVSQISRGQGHEFLNKFEVAGLDSSLAQAVVDSKDNVFAQNIVRYIRGTSLKETPSQKEAHRIMGSSYFGLREAVIHLGANPTIPEISAFSEVTFPTEELWKRKDTHILVADYGNSILEISDIVGRDVFQKGGDDWYDSQEHIKRTGKKGWRLVRKSFVPDSGLKKWDDQQETLPKDEEMPSARVMVYAIVGHFLKTGERLFQKDCVRTSCIGSGVGHVFVGHFRNSLCACGWGDSDRNENIGISSTIIRRPLGFLGTHSS